VAERTNVPLAPLTTLRLGGVAARMMDVEREGDVLDVVRDVEARGDEMFVLGGGSNLVVGDEGFAGTVARMAMRGVKVAHEGDRVVVDVAAGEDWDAFVARAVDEGWSGIECMSGIPGLVGATPIQNVGAYGQEVSDTIARVRVFDREERAFVDVDARGCAFGYRASLFKYDLRWIVTSVRFVLPVAGDAVVSYAELSRALAVRDGGRAPSRAIRSTVIALRRAKGMVLDAGDPESVSAGSFFVNPVFASDAFDALERRARDAGVLAEGERMPRFRAGEGRYKASAGWLVERAGFVKGYGNSAVGVSRKHALALVHRGSGSARELLALARAIRDGVRARFGVTLVPEPVLVGCSWE
jgi:UDP-N-acetylmuramate dehydrogenase